MFPALSDQISGFVTNLTTGVKTVFQPFSLQSLEGFPYTDFMEQKAKYQEIKRWFTNEVFSETITNEKTGVVTERYPIKINPLLNTAQKHTAVLFGSSLNSMRLGGVPVIIEVNQKKDKENKEKIESVLSKIFEDSFAGSLFVENGVTSQEYGGCIFGAFFNPRTGKIQIQNPSPPEFFGIPDGPSLWTFKETWIIREITQLEAKKSYSVETSAVDGKYYYIEHWTLSEIEVSVNGTPVYFNGVPLSGPNPYGLIPHVYIPHLRAGGLWGNSILNEAIKGILREINLRQADLGDAVSDDSHQILAVRNIKGSLTTKTISGAGGRTVVDLGSGGGMPGATTDPDLFAVKSSSIAAPSIDYIRDLEKLYRREANHPAVADGEDEGSQRSSLTLTTRMFPLVTEVELERMFWSVGLIAFGKILLKMSAIKTSDVTLKEAEDVSLVCRWAPMLPRERMDIVNEAAIRSKNDLGSRVTLMNMFGDIEDADAEFDVIIEEKEALAEVQAKIKEMFTPEPDNSGNAGGSDPSDKTDPNKAGDNQVK